MISDILAQRNWTILTGSYGKEGGWSYIAKMRALVIDYAVTNADAKEEILMVDERSRTFR